MPTIRVSSLVRYRAGVRFEWVTFGACNPDRPLTKLVAVPLRCCYGSHPPWIESLLPEAIHLLDLDTVLSDPAGTIELIRGGNLNELVWLRSHLERCLQDTWQDYSVAMDDDGDYPFRFGTAACYISITPIGDEHHIRVWAIAARDIVRSAKMFSELNDFNAQVRSAHAFWFYRTIYVEQLVHADGLTAATVAQAYLSVGTLADELGVLLASMFGGQTPYQVEAGSGAAGEADRG
jgi:hypothetical protein